MYTPFFVWILFLLKIVRKVCQWCCLYFIYLLLRRKLKHTEVWFGVG